ncbi:MAG: universal stress protein, partial [Alphaproteobacteria bacterium]
MTYRAILIPLLGGTAEPAALQTAIALTRRSAGHLTGLHIKPDPRDVMPYISEGASGALVTELMAATEKEGDERAREAKKRFTEAVKAAGIDMVERPGGRGGATCSWREVVGREEVVVRRIGRMVDVVVMSWPSDADNVEQAVTLDAAMFDTARPVLLVPPDRTVSGADTICLAWNG